MLLIAKIHGMVKTSIMLSCTDAAIALVMNAIVVTGFPLLMMNIIKFTTQKVFTAKHLHLMLNIIVTDLRTAQKLTMMQPTTISVTAVLVNCKMTTPTFAQTAGTASKDRMIPMVRTTKLTPIVRLPCLMNTYKHGKVFNALIKLIHRNGTIIVRIASASPTLITTTMKTVSMFLMVTMITSALIARLA